MNNRDWDVISCLTKTGSNVSKEACDDGDVKDDQNKQVTRDVSRHNLFTFYENLECIAFLIRFCTPTKIRASALLAGDQSWPFLLHFYNL